MTDLIYDFITQGIDLLIVGVVLIAMVTLLVAANKLTNVISTQDSMNDRIAKVKEFNQYDGQKVLPQEVGSAIMKYCKNENNYAICIINGIDAKNKVLFTGNDISYDENKTASISVGGISVNGNAINVSSFDYVSEALGKAGVKDTDMYRAVLLTSKTVTTDEDTGSYNVSFAVTSASSGDVILGIGFINDTLYNESLPGLPPESSEVEASETPIDSEVLSSE